MYTNLASPQSNLLIEYLQTTDGLSAHIKMENLHVLGDTAKIVALVDVLHREFNFSHPEDISLGSPPEAQQQQLRAYERALSDLTAQTAKMKEESAKVMVEQAEYFRKRSEEMDTEVQERRQKLQSEHERAMESVKVRETAFETKVKEFELREGTAVRRDLAKRHREDIAKQLGVSISSRTLQQRLVVHCVCVVVLIGLSLLIAWGVEKILAEPGTASAARYIPLAGLTVLFGSTLWFYLRFNSLWGDRLAQAELSTQKYANDFKRADWLTELVCEYSKDAGKEFPPEVAARLAQNLFSDVRWGKQNLHPGDDVVDFLGRVSKFKSTRDGVEVELVTENDKK